jgi:hypothetical protein
MNLSTRTLVTSSREQRAETLGQAGHAEMWRGGSQPPWEGVERWPPLKLLSTTTVPAGQQTVKTWFWYLTLAFISF